MSCWVGNFTDCHETLYSDKLVNIVALVVSDDYADNEEVRQIYDVFEARVRKNGYCGLRMTANVRRKIFSKLLSQHDLESHSDLKHYLKCLTSIRWPGERMRTAI